MKKSIIALMGVVCLVTLLGGCSSYEKRWDAFAVEHSEGQGVVGRWRGTWRSESTGHSGDLRCMISPLKDGLYQAEYHATFMGALTSEYQSTFQPRYVGGRFQFEGAQDLGFLGGGVYLYDAEVDGDQFFATYRSKDDHGEYRMQRVRRERNVAP